MEAERARPARGRRWGQLNPPHRGGGRGRGAPGGGGGMAGRRLNVNVGVLGHIDSGKTALARALSTTASTAAFDKQPQSRERGITLDLGFSCFSVPLPARLRSALPAPAAAPEPGPEPEPEPQLQVTLVDCPGHASLIRTIIGGERGPGREPGSAAGEGDHHTSQVGSPGPGRPTRLTLPAPASKCAQALRLVLTAS